MAGFSIISFGSWINKIKSILKNKKHCEDSTSFVTI